jgi:hypothetical protein
VFTRPGSLIGDAVYNVSGPEVRDCTVAVRLEYVALRLSKCYPDRISVHQMRIKLFHHEDGKRVIDGPESGYNRVSARKQKRS